MLISFTGAQSSGKTTMLQECFNMPEFRKYNCVKEVTRKVARLYNVDINEAGGDVTQLFILHEHLKNHHMKGDSILDRCIIDGLVYTEYLYEQGKVSDWVYQYAKNLYDMLLPKLNVIFYTDPRDVPIHDDGQRSVDHTFRDCIINKFEKIIQNGLPDDIEVVRLIGNITQRRDTILETIKQYDDNIR